MGQTGLITFSEYLFLLCILTRPRQGFDVAFKMFDEDGNKQIDYDEFKLLGQGCLKNGWGPKESGFIFSSRGPSPISAISIPRRTTR